MLATQSVNANLSERQPLLVLGLMVQYFPDLIQINDDDDRYMEGHPVIHGVVIPLWHHIDPAMFYSLGDTLSVYRSDAPSDGRDIASQCGAKQPAGCGLTPSRLKHVLDFMESNINKQIRVRQLSRCAGLSTTQFSAQFRISTGYAPYQYLLRLRIDRAKYLLKNPRLSILEVSMAVGFDNQQHFATVFRRLSSVSPSSYRKGI